MKKIWIHYEGNRALKVGFRALFGRLLPLNRIPKFVPGEAEPIRSFFNSIKSYPDHNHLLLIDSDKLVEEFSNKDLFEIIRLRKDWKKRPKVSNDKLFFMIQSMEAWFLIDQQILIDYFGKQGFKKNALPKRVNTEEIENPYTLLQTATEGTIKGEYNKTQHAPELLALINTNKISEKTAPHCKRLFDALTQKLQPLD